MKTQSAGGLPCHPVSSSFGCPRYGISFDHAIGDRTTVNKRLRESRLHPFSNLDILTAATTRGPAHPWVP